MSDPNTIFRHAGELCMSGAFAEAATLYQQLLAQMPGHPQILGALGLAQMQQGSLDEAILHLQKSLSIQASQPAVWCNLGNALRRQRRYDEALSALDGALALQPGLYEAWMARGNVFWDQERFDIAVVAYEQAVALRPADPRAHFNCANTLHRLKRVEEAVAHFASAVSLDPNYAEAHNNMSNALSELRRFADALEAVDRALAIRPDYAQAHFNRGNLLGFLRRFDEAVASYTTAIALDPQQGEVFHRRGQALEELDCAAEALADQKRALELTPDNTEARINISTALAKLHRFDEAIDNYDAILAEFPDNAEAHWNKSLLVLTCGDLAAGWPDYEWRWRIEGAATYRETTHPQWNGEDLTGKTVLIWEEQGYGDFIQFCRYVPMLNARGAHVILEVSPRLLPLMARLKADVTLIETGAPRPEYDLQCPVMSLPFVFQTTFKTIPADIPYLSAEPAKMPVLAARARIGLIWTGSINHVDDKRRSVGLESLAPLLGLPFEFHSLQKEYRSGDAEAMARFPELHQHADEQNDFSDAAALISAMDLVITVDTAVAHLAGALGKPVWILLPHLADWRWFRGREDSPWYPAARLFRQSAPGDWASVVAALCAALEDRWPGLRA